MSDPHARDGHAGAGELRLVLAYMGAAGLLLLAMMVLGLWLRAAQAEWLALRADWFYRVLTLHGTGMVALSSLAGSGIMWYFLAAHVRLSLALGWVHFGLFLAGVGCVVLGIVAGGYAGAWTFLYPLPASQPAVWSTAGASAFLAGMLLVGVGFLLLYADCARAILARYGGLGRALGWPRLFRRYGEPAPPPAVIASTMVVIVNVAGIAAGAGIIVASLVHLWLPALAPDPLLAKNLIYFFGHVFVNATIYMAVIAVYELLPRYTGRPWLADNRVFVGAWTASTVMVLLVYPHHLLMDFVQPLGLHVIGQVLSHANGLPVLVVTAYGALVNVHRSGMRWRLPAALLFLGTFGWAAGVVPAMVDSTIAVNAVMHNTFWVPAHFHFYLLLGMTAMALGFMLWLARTYGRAGEGLADRLAFWAYVAGGAGFVGMFLLQGREGTPRRFAVHTPEWVPYDRVATAFALLVVLATALFLIRFGFGLATALRRASPG